MAACLPRSSSCQSPRSSRGPPERDDQSSHCLLPPFFEKLIPRSPTFSHPGSPLSTRQMRCCLCQVRVRAWTISGRPEKAANGICTACNFSCVMKCSAAEEGSRAAKVQSRVSTIHEKLLIKTQVDFICVMPSRFWANDVVYVLCSAAYCCDSRATTPPSRKAEVDSVAAGTVHGLRQLRRFLGKTGLGGVVPRVQ